MNCIHGMCIARHRSSLATSAYDCWICNGSKFDVCEVKNCLASASDAKTQKIIARSKASGLHLLFRFVQEKFEDIFKKHARSNGNSLTAQELDELLKANKEPNDRLGPIAGAAEWKILYFLCKDKNGLLAKETVRGVYDGSLFEQMAKEHQSKKKA